MKGSRPPERVGGLGPGIAMRSGQLTRGSGSLTGYRMASMLAQKDRAYLRHRGPVLLVGLGLSCLAGSYLWLAMGHGTGLLWNVVVHESGRYTLGKTMFYFDHFLREVPVDVAMALFVVAALTGPRRSLAEQSARIRPRPFARLAWGAAVLLVVLALAVTAKRSGLDSALQDLMQFRTRDDLSDYGSHWRFHWLSTIWFGAAAAILTRIAAGRQTGGFRNLWDRRSLWLVAWAYVVLLSLVCGLSIEPFMDPRFIGHQAREILTHGLVTGPLAIGCQLILVNSDAMSRVRRSAAAFVFSGGGTVSLFVLVAIPFYLIGFSLGGQALWAAQTGGGWAAMIAAHFFEHTLDYVFVLLLSGGAHAWLSALRH